MLGPLVAGFAIYATAFAAPHLARNNNAHPYVNIKDGTVTGRNNAAFGQQ